MGVLIHDGYTLDGKTPPMGHAPEVSFRYRPALPEQVYEYQRATRNSGKEELRIVVDFLIKHLVSWDVVDKSGETVPVTPETLRKVPYRILQKFLDFVTGYDILEQGQDAKN